MDDVTRVAGQEALVARLHTLSVAASIFGVGIGLVVLFGWIAHVSILTRVLPGLSTMKVNTASCFVLCGLSLWFHLRPSSSKTAGIAATGMAALAAMIAGLTLLEYLSGLDLTIDQLLVVDSISTSGIPGRMGPSTASCFVLLGVSLILLNTYQALAQALALGAAGIAGIAVLGYVYSVPSLEGLSSHTQMALHTAATLVALGCGIASVHARRGPMGIITSSGPGGMLSRTMLPAIVFGPVLLGWFRLLGQHAGWYGTELGIALFAMSTVAMFSIIVAIFAGRLDRSDATMRAGHQAAAVTSDRLAALVASSDDAIIGKDLAGIITSWNSGAERIFGYSAGEIIGTSILRLIPGDRQDEERHILETIHRGERVQQLETVRKTRDGRLLDVSITASPIRDAGGTIVGASKVARDVTERKRAQEALAESERRLQFALAVGQIGHWELDLTNHTAYRSLRHDQIFGYETLLPEWTYENFIEHVVQEDRDLVDEKFRKAVAAQRDWDFECRIVRRDHEVRWISAAGRPQGGKLGEPQRLVGIVQDITARKEAADALQKAEERMRFALENANVGIWDMDYATGVLRWSETLEAQYGLSPGTFEGTFEAFVERIHPDDRASVLETVQKTMESGADFSVESRTIWPDGTIRWLSGVGRVLLGEHGEPVRGVGISLDITARRTLEAQYQQAQKMEAIGRLAGGVAHDFNNLLTAILGYCELLLADLKPGDPRQADVTEIQRAGLSAAGLTRQLLAFSRKQIIEPTLIDLGAVVAELRPMLGRLIGEDVKIVLTLQDDLAPVMADHGEMEQVILNLAVNARDAMPRGGTLTLETANVDLDENYVSTHFAVKPGPYVALTVTDTGTGITPEIQARLFEPFFTTKEVGKGTGLGLASVHGIVMRSGGSVNVYSEVGTGTSFKVYLPRTDAAAMRVDAPRPPARPRVGVETVLVVEDSDGLRELAKRLLERQGYIVLVAANADEALRLFEQHPSIDVLLTDVVMPGASGPELTRQLIQQRPALKVIYMSGYTEEAIVQHGVLKHGIAFLQKPFNSETLGQKIRETLER